MLMDSVRVRNSIIIVSSINSVSYKMTVQMICTYISNCLLRLFMLARMFLCNYNAFLSLESLCWIISNTCNYSETKNQPLGILLTRYILCSLLGYLASRHECRIYSQKKGRHYFKMQQKSPFIHPEVKRQF